MLTALKWISRVFLFIGFVLFFASIGGIYNQWEIGSSASGYRPASIEVSSVEYRVSDRPHRHGDSFPVSIGSTLVEGKEENISFEPFMPTGAYASSQAELEKMFPKGTRLEVLYNPTASDTLLNGRYLRVLPRTYDINNLRAYAIRQFLGWNSIGILGLLLFVLEKRLRKQSKLKPKKKRHIQKKAP